MNEKSFGQVFGGWGQVEGAVAFFADNWGGRGRIIRFDGRLVLRFNHYVMWSGKVCMFVGGGRGHEMARRMSRGMKDELRNEGRAEERSYKCIELAEYRV